MLATNRNQTESKRTKPLQRYPDMRTNQSHRYPVGVNSNAKLVPMLSHEVIQRFAGSIRNNDKLDAVSILNLLHTAFLACTFVRSNINVCLDALWQFSYPHTGLLSDDRPDKCAKRFVDVLSLMSGVGSVKIRDKISQARDSTTWKVGEQSVFVRSFQPEQDEKDGQQRESNP